MYGCTVYVCAARDAETGYADATWREEEKSALYLHCFYRCVVRLIVYSLLVILLVIDMENMNMA